LKSNSITSRRPSALKFSRELPKADVRELMLPNGLRIVSEVIPGATSVAVGAWIGAGSRDEKAEEYGTAHFIEHVAFKGTKNYSMKEIMHLVETRGGSLNAFTTKEQTCYYAWVRTAFLEDAVAMVSDLALRPKISESAVSREKDVIIEEIHGLDDEPDEMLFDLFEATVFKGTGLEHQVIGTEKSVAASTRKSLRSFYNRFYTPNNITLVASGSHNHNDLTRFAKKYFSDADPQLVEFSREHLLPEPTKGKRKKEIHKGIGQSHIILGRPTFGMNDQRLPALSLLTTLIGVGMPSRLNIRLREELGLAYETTAFQSPFSEIGAIGLYAAITATNSKRVESEMRKIIRSLFTKPVSDDELERTKEQIVGSLILGLESMTARLMRVGHHLYYQQHYEDLITEIKKILAVRRRDLFELADELFRDETLLSVVSIASH
jgi:predicted Zn-dependent peptidase